MGRVKSFERSLWIVIAWVVQWLAGKISALAYEPVIHKPTKIFINIDSGPDELLDDIVLALKKDERYELTVSDEEYQVYVKIKTNE